MKKLAVAVLMLTMCFGLSACGGNTYERLNDEEKIMYDAIDSLYGDLKDPQSLIIDDAIYSFLGDDEEINVAIAYKAKNSYGGYGTGYQMCSSTGCTSEEVLYTSMRALINFDDSKGGEIDSDRVVDALKNDKDYKFPAME